MNLSFDTFKEQIARDKKKTAILVSLFVVLLFVVGRLFISGASPQAAEALIVVQPATAASSASGDLTRPTLQPIAPAQSVAAHPGAATEQGAFGTSPRPRQTASRAVMVSDISRDIERDIFASTSWDRFPLSEQALEEKEKRMKLEKEREAEERKAREQERIRLEEERRHAERQRDEARRQEEEKFAVELGALDLQSTMTGVSKSAYISGRFVREGDAVFGFTVLQISDRQVLLGRGALSGMIQMR